MNNYTIKNGYQVRKGWDIDDVLFEVSKRYAKQKNWINKALPLLSNFKMLIELHYKGGDMPGVYQDLRTIESLIEEFEK